MKMTATFLIVLSFLDLQVNGFALSGINHKIEKGKAVVQIKPMLQEAVVGAQSSLLRSLPLEDKRRVCRQR
jgi:hypothetical protein